MLLYTPSLLCGSVFKCNCQSLYSLLLSSYHSLWHYSGLVYSAITPHIQWASSNNSQLSTRVWKGILGILDLTKIRCGMRENEKYLDGIRDLTATREAGFAKIWLRDAGFCCLSVGNSGNRHDPNKRYSGKSESTSRAQNINEKGQSTS